jgi:hypothetical protein
VSVRRLGCPHGGVPQIGQPKRLTLTAYLLLQQIFAPTWWRRLSARVGLRETSVNLRCTKHPVKALAPDNKRHRSAVFDVLFIPASSADRSKKRNKIKAQLENRQP